jgi:hypothetical protein
MPQQDLLIFISHSSRDHKIAEALVDLLRAALLDLSPASIRCTSVDGYGLPGGPDVEANLRVEVQAAKVFVALVTPNSLASQYVMFELGARWGIQGSFLPLLAHITPQNLGPPLSILNTLSARKEADIQQLLDEISVRLDRKLAPAQSFGKYIARLKKLASPRLPVYEVIAAAIIGVVIAATGLNYILSRKQSVLSFSAANTIMLFYPSVYSIKLISEQRYANDCSVVSLFSALQNAIHSENPRANVDTVCSPKQDGSLTDVDLVILGGPVRTAQFEKIRNEMLVHLPTAFRDKLPFDFSKTIYASARDGQPYVNNAKNGIVIGYEAVMGRVQPLHEDEAIRRYCQRDGESWYFHPNLDGRPDPTVDQLCSGSEPALVRQQEGSPSGDKEEDYATDYCLLIFGPNPFDRHHKLIVISGIHRQGTDGGVQYVLRLSQDDVDELRKKADRISDTASNSYLFGVVKVPRKSKGEAYYPVPVKWVTF